MRIVYVYRSLAVWGGVERILVDKMNELVAHYGHEVTLLTTDQGEHQAPYQFDARVGWVDLGIRFHQQYHYRGWKRLWVWLWLHLKYEWRLHKTLYQLHPQILVCTTADHVGALMRHKRKQVPLVVESHSIFAHSFESRHPKWLRWWAMHSYQHHLAQASSLVALTEADARQWRQLNERALCIPNMVHLNPLQRYSDGLAHRAIFVGRLSAQKQIHHLVDIWQRVQRVHPDWMLRVYGDGELHNWLVQQVEQKKLSIEIFPPTRQIFDAYIDSSMLLLTSAYEPFGLVIPEAMSCRLPVVSYDCPYGPGDMIVNRVNGRLIPLGDQERFVQAVCELIEKPDMRIAMGKKAQECSLRFAPDVIMPRWEQLWRQLTD